MVTFKDAVGYDKSSKTQFEQGDFLIDNICLKDDDYVLDLGCGNGRTTIQLVKRYSIKNIDAIDQSPQMIELARENAKKNGMDNISFRVMDATDLDLKEKYDIIFSNSTLHWIQDQEEMYKKIHIALKPNGKIGIHQGGEDCYKGLQEVARKAVEITENSKYFENWSYPAYYLSKSEIIEILEKTGFNEINVISRETDGKEHPTLCVDFSKAGLLPYLGQIPEEKREEFLNVYLELAKDDDIDTYTHRLYIFAKK